MRHYTQLAIIGSKLGEETVAFQKRIADKIEEFQVDDYGAEIQFQVNDTQLAVLVLQYKEV